jgi:hypothetical protein
MNEPAIEVGCGVSDITPKPGTALSGFIFRENKPSTHVDDPLSVRALALRQGGEVYFLISYELLAISEPLEQQILAALQDALGESFSRQRAVLLATHTHSAPPVSPIEGEAAPNTAYWRLVCERTAEATRQALTHLRPASLHVASFRVPGYTYNRRAVLTDGRVTMVPEPDAPVLERGPVDDTLTVLVWRDSQGETIATALHFACHGTAVCTQGIGGDVPGALARRAEAIFHAPCMFLQGAAGDTNPLTTISADRAGLMSWAEKFAVHLQGLPAKLHPLPCTPFRTASTVLPLNYQPLPSRPAVQRSIANFERIVQGEIDAPEVQETLLRLGNIMNFKPGERPDPAKAAFAAGALANAERRVLAAIDTGRPPLPCPLSVAVWRMGQITFAFAAAELFALTGFHIRAMGRGRAVLPVTYASPIVGYVPDRASMEKGGYEADDAWRFYGHPAAFAPDTEERIVETIRSLNALV